MSKKVVIKENIIDEPEETREEILEQIEEPKHQHLSRAPHRRRKEELA